MAHSPCLFESLRVSLKVETVVRKNLVQFSNFSVNTKNSARLGSSSVNVVNVLLTYLNIVNFKCGQERKSM